ncbi:heavy-metal-associated domain-containing protein [Thermoanaerobacterium thermosaccharolyticum]|uniref:Heavy metal transport detoxification protein n=1 Tax=Thermoanaerobacterium thermosaccharolyticum TaxID=1517 RepID=A0A231VML7_THETR|nr:cation transporter [Thermoanaerobacterium thermosaccharolyticum]AST56418.1 heavy metal transport detoxification protein [Thermoanaerobacterium thermosaccharolyticum]MCP2239691.1 copper chaperone CopZ [Thermoanaerobacterium thermosaccharolyticum]OXT09329.1 heavy metal transporter [Thermoanaerobacterium thermosaccharolyticum]
MIKDVKLNVEGLSCPDCSKKIEQALASQEGVKEAKVLFTTGVAKVKFDDGVIGLDKIKSVIKSFGFNVSD